MTTPEVHVHVHLHQAPDPRVGEILTVVRNIQIQGDHFMADLDRLTTEVTETRTVVDSAIALINGLAQQIRDLANDPAALNALADSLDADQADLAAAISANTPATTDPPVDTPPA